MCLSLPSLQADCLVVTAGERVVYFLGPVPQDKLPKDANPGSSLSGSLKLGLLQGSKEHAPGAFPVFYRQHFQACWHTHSYTVCYHGCCKSLDHSMVFAIALAL